MSEAADWSVLTPDVMTLAGRAARRMADGYEERLTMEYDDAFQEAALILATKPEMVRECLAHQELGLGVLYHRLLLDLTDQIKTQARHRARHVSYEAACERVGAGEA